MTINSVVIDAATAPKQHTSNGSAKEMAEWDGVVAGLAAGKAVKVAVPAAVDGKDPARSITLRLRKAVQRVHPDANGDVSVFDGKDGFAYAVRNGAKS